MKTKNRDFIFESGQAIAIILDKDFKKLAEEIFIFKKVITRHICQEK